MDQTDACVGEKITNLREYLRRYTLLKMYPVEGDLDNYSVTRIVVPTFPQAYGWDPSGWDTNNLVPASKCNYCASLPLTILNMAFGAWRGGIKRKLAFTYSNTSAIATAGMSRYPIVTRAQYGTVGSFKTVFTNATFEDLLKRLSNGEAFNATSLGTATQDIWNNGFLEIESPFYIGQLRFASARSNNARALVTEGVRIEILQSPQAAASKLLVTEFVAIGDDFTMFFFVGCPILYGYTLPV